MPKKFATKSAITQIVWEISPRCLHLVGVFGVGLLNDLAKFSHD